MKVAALLLACASPALAFMPFAPKSTSNTFISGTPFNTIDVSEGLAVEDKSLSGLSVFEKATSDFGKKYPVPFARGLGPTTKAERWNGRHAMAGWIALLATGYAQSHGLIPQGNLDPKEWGTWVIISTTNGVQNTIPIERATIAIAHLHLAAVGVFAAFNKESVKDKLLLEPGEKDEPAAGLFVPLKPGLTKEAELLNGRLAMLGLIVLVATAVGTQQSILSVIDQGLGGLLL